MQRLLNFVLIGLMLAGAAFTFEIKHRAEQAATDVRQLKRQILLENETVQLLKAELSVLAQPTLLQNLTVQHASALKLVPATADQIISLRDLPNSHPLLPKQEGVPEMDQNGPSGSARDYHTSLF